MCELDAILSQCCHQSVFFVVLPDSSLERSYSMNRGRLLFRRFPLIDALGQYILDDAGDGVVADGAGDTRRTPRQVAT